MHTGEYKLHQKRSALAQNKKRWDENKEYEKKEIAQEI